MASREQRWDPERYRRNAGFVAELGAPLIDLLAPRPGERVLDLGCGDGRLTEKLVDLGAAVVGVDASAEQVAAARAREVPIVAMVQSWDNLSSKGTFPIRFDQVVVWSEVLREEVERLYGYAPEEVAVTGIPQFDRYADKTRLAAREDFFQEIGADPARKLIVYTCGTEKISPREPELVGLLAEAIGRGAVRPAAQLLVRPHYRDNPARYAAVRRLPHVLFRPPGRFSRVVERFWNPDESDLDHFCNLLHHADVVVNVASTVTIDAAPFDTPVVNVAFDGAAPRPYYQSTRRYYDYSHYRRIVASGGVRLAHGAEELVAHVNAYLADPALDREGRARIVAEQCYRVDGESGRRIGRVLLQRLEATASARPAAALG